MKTISALALAAAIAVPSAGVAGNLSAPVVEPIVVPEDNPVQAGSSMGGGLGVAAVIGGVLLVAAVAAASSDDDDDDDDSSGGTGDN